MTDWSPGDAAADTGSETSAPFAAKRPSGKRHGDLRDLDALRGRRKDLAPDAHQLFRTLYQYG